MNSLKSACSFAKTTPMAFDQFQQEVEPFLGRKVRVELVVSLLCFFKTAKYPDDSIHERSLRPICSPPPNSRHSERGGGEGVSEESQDT